MAKFRYKAPDFFVDVEFYDAVKGSVHVSPEGFAAVGPDRKPVEVKHGDALVLSKDAAGNITGVAPISREEFFASYEPADGDAKRALKLSSSTLDIADKLGTGEPNA